MRTETAHPHLDPIGEDAAVRALADSLERSEHVGTLGIAGSSPSMIVGAIARLTGRPVVACLAHLDDADEMIDELSGVGVEGVRLPALEVLPGETGVSLELFAERVSVVRRVVAEGFDDPRESGLVLVCPIQSLMQGVPSAERLGDLVMALEPGDGRGPEAVGRWLTLAGYQRLDSIEEPGDFAVRGGIIDVFLPHGESGAGGAVRLDFFGDELESIHEIDVDTMGSDRRLHTVELIGASLETATSDEKTVSFLDIVPQGAIAVVVESLEVIEQGRGYYERVVDGAGVIGPPAVMKTLRERFHALCEISHFSATDAPTRVELPVSPLPEFSRDASEAVGELAVMSREGDVLVLCQNEGERQRFGELVRESGGGTEIQSTVAYLHRGFLWEGERGLVLVPYHELLHRYHTRRRIRRLRGGRSADTFLELEVGDYVVHQDHGVARFIGLKLMKPNKTRATPERRAEEKLAKARGEKTGDAPGEEFLTLEFAGKAKLHVPVSQIDKVQKYIGGFHGRPPLSALGGKKWQSQKDRTKESVRDLAAELLRVQAAREHSPGMRFPTDTAWQIEFEAEFPYEETEDQLASLAEIKKDMHSDRPMDRLLCGDVGYGKTELAIRAAFKAAEFGRQVAVLVPTTILAEQHERTFRERFADYPFVVESLSRFKTRSEQNNVLMRARKGQVDILIGTHRLLSKDVKFADLGLVIVDEEQRFGVEHKQTLLQLRVTADVLTLSATPIPRTLHMSMLGLRDISSLSTPPLDRRAVVTEVIPYNEQRIKRAIERELARDGQVFFVHNRVHNIQSVADDIAKLAPKARIAIGHGQMTGHELEKVMSAFIHREIDILVSTTIIESGIDIPTANTMIINNADRFGLAELHQLRGRVGRYKHRAYCYMLLPGDRPVTEIAARRLRAIEEFSMLGAGFKIAMRDLEIRGAGNLLGAEQSGHIAAVGYDMYCRLLDEAARELRNESTIEPSATTIEIGLTGALPRAYIPSDTRRLEAYRRIATARTHDELARVRQDLSQAYSQPPDPAERLLDLAELRIGAHEHAIRAITVYEHDVIFRCEDQDRVVQALDGAAGSIRPISRKPNDDLLEVYYRPPESYLEPISLLRVLIHRFAAAGALSG